MRTFLNAVVFGRYSIVTPGHLAQVRKAQELAETVTVGVLDLSHQQGLGNELRTVGDEFIEMCDANCSPARNPFTIEEKLQMWAPAVKQAFPDGTVQVESVRRPELYPDEFNHRFPAETVQLLMTAPGPTCSEFDRLRRGEFVRRLERSVVEIEPELVVHTTDLIRTASERGEWASLLAPGVLDVFLSLNGPQRLQARNEAT
ncbi:hypothetical protein ACO229_11510 [Promicromonospora sp. MS192]|uniref:hypothetical protein n=1 Tax=Promicromonospora sp. MS192 TaxID=3412684 RepID=UPI003C30C22B